MAAQERPLAGRADGGGPHASAALRGMYCALRAAFSCQLTASGRIGSGGLTWGLQWSGPEGLRPEA